MLKTKIAVLSVVVVLAGCQNDPGSTAEDHTNTSARHSQTYTADSGAQHDLTAAALIGQRDGEIQQGISVRYTAKGIGWAHFREAWSSGQQLPYKGQSLRTAGCTASGCTIIEEGVIELTPQQFDRAAEDGIEFKLVGSSTQIVGKLPAEAFQEALAKR